MELTMQHTSSASFSKSIGDLKLQVHNKFEANSWRAIDFKLHEQRRNGSLVSHALPETVASIAVASIVVGAAATLLAKRNEASEVDEIPMKNCEDCGGSGICSECRGEGFVLKRLSEGSAEKARLTAKNAATRYTAGLPKKWSYCTKCSSSRSCLICAGRGKVTI